MSSSPATKAQQAYAAIRSRIITCELRPGEMLTEARLTELTGFGHTPIRDALQRLAAEGLVTVSARRGTFVAAVNLDDAQQIFDLRVAIEGVIAEQVIARLADSDVELLDELISLTEVDDSIESDPAIDTRFHELLLDVAGNRFLTDVYVSLHDASMRLFYLTRCGMEPRTQQLTTLRATRAAFAARDVAALRETLTEHVSDFRRRVGGAL